MDPIVFTAVILASILHVTWNGMVKNHSMSGWHIDHRIPLDSAKTYEDIERLIHYTNLQPMWAIENLKKSNKILPD